MNFRLSLLSLLVVVLLSGCASGGTGVTKATRFGTREHVDRQVATQISLAKSNFSVGEIDGRDGTLTNRAAERFVMTHAGSPGVPLVSKPYTTYTIRAEDFKYVGPIDPTNEGQAKMKYLTYETVLELVAERYHASQALIIYLNGLPPNPALVAGQTLVVPNVEPFRIEAMGVKSGGRAANGNYVRISANRGTLEVLNKDGALVAYYPVSVGSAQNSTPKGEWKIINQVPLPTFRWDEEMLNKGVRSQDFFMFPPGPNNPVGVYWNGLNKLGVGIHGNPLPETVFQGRSHGCIRMTNWDVITLPRYVGIGSKVVIE
ncbi:hypothetical protein AYO41_04325 [Verrucomicrobia bacterium SCGC AG-212-E04]|nr:hypothetical protein AYO41_04325 [Verrucomicrobia bacterium SCGC AG-212-E04]